LTKEEMDARKKHYQHFIKTLFKEYNDVTNGDFGENVFQNLYNLEGPSNSSNHVVMLFGHDMIKPYK
jgi:hypothetical protein